MNKNMSIQDIAWLAGLFEGEGSICIRDRSVNKNRPSAFLRIGMTDGDVIQTVFEKTNVGTVLNTHSPSHKARGNKPLFIWTVAGMEEVEFILYAILPFLHSRRAQKAQEALDALKIARRTKESSAVGRPYK